MQVWDDEIATANQVRHSRTAAQAVADLTDEEVMASAREANPNMSDETILATYGGLPGLRQGMAAVRALQAQTRRTRGRRY